jgi:hypothetical protein
MAAKTIGSQYDFQKIPILNIVVHSASSAPSSPVNGQLWYDTTGNVLNGRINGTWTQLDNTGVLTSASTAGGDLSGVFSNLQIVANAVGTTEVANSAITYAKIQNVSATDRILGRDTAGAGVVEELSVSGGLEFTGSSGIQRSALTGDVTATAGSNATTIATNAVTLAKLATAVSLNGIASTNAATADITASGFKITNLGTPTNATDAATKSYVDARAAGLDPKASVRIASSQAVTVTYTAAGGTSARGQITAAPLTLTTIDAGTAGNVVAGDRILLKDQAAPAQNGIWVVTTIGSGANGVWDRATDFDEDAEVTAGAFTFVAEGTVNADTGWVLSTNDPIIIGGGSGTSLTFVQFSSAGTILAGNGLTKTGSTIDVVGTTNRISVAADSIDISSAFVGQATITTLGTVTTGTWTGTSIAVANGGTGATTAAGARTNLGAVGKFASTLGALSAGVETTITHSLGSSDVITQFRDASTNFEIEFNWRVVDANTVGVTADIAYGASAVRCVVIG